MQGADLPLTYRVSSCATFGKGCESASKRDLAPHDKPLKKPGKTERHWTQIGVDGTPPVRQSPPWISRLVELRRGSPFNADSHPNRTSGPLQLQDVEGGSLKVSFRADGQREQPTLCRS